MLYPLANLYGRFFARKSFFKLNKLLYHCALRGMGIMNVERTGEYPFLNSLKLKKGDVVLDIGGNVGKYSQHLKKQYPEVDILAFEPNPASFSKLAEQAKALGFKAFNFGFSNQEGTATIYDTVEKSGSAHASLYAEVIEDLHKSTLKPVEITLKKLDDFLEEQKIERIALLKIDTEGHELAILNGALNAIRQGKIERIHFEFNEMNLISKATMYDFYKLLGDNFSFYRILPHGLLPLEAYTPLYHELYAFQNIVALRKP